MSKQLSPKSDVPSLRRKKWVTLLSLLLWAQLIFSAGLTAWRYQLVVTQNWPIYPSDNSPQINQFAAFIKTNCAGATAVGYRSVKYNSFARLSYELYPQPLHNLSTLTEKDAQDIIINKEIECLISEGDPDPSAISGRLASFSNTQHIFILETIQ